MNRTITFVSCVLLCASLASGQWRITTGVHDDTPNGTGHQTPSIGVVSNTMMVALVNRPVGIVQSAPFDDVNLVKDSSAATYLVGYSNWGIETGRLGAYPYGSAGTLGLFSKWFSGFDEVFLYRANKIVVTPDSLIYVANNDPEHNILVFRVTKDTIETTDYRMKTGDVDIQGLAVDDNGYVYVSAVKGSDANTAEIKVFKGIKAAGNTWATTHDDAPVSTVNLPTGVYRGIAVNGGGSWLFVSDMVTNSVKRYSGSPTTGYQISPSFSFSLTDADTVPGTNFDTLSTTTWNTGHPLGMGYMNGNNLLFVASARWLGNSIRGRNNSSCYTYSKVFILNPNTGARVDSIDVAKYYFDSTGSYTSQSFLPEKFVSGYASVYDIAFDANKDLYIQSMYSWTVEKWSFNGTLPTFPVLSVRRTDDAAPAGFSLAQNFPNPFNPSTTITFTVPAAAAVSVTVYDILGKEVATLVNGELEAGTYTAGFNARDLASGLYFYTLRSGSFSTTRKMMLMK